MDIIDNRMELYMTRYNPMSKEFQEECKRLGLTGNQFIQKLRQEGRLIDIYKADCKYNDKWAKNLGYKDYKEYIREYVKRRNWEKGYSSPMSENERCSSYLGVHIIERIVGRIILPIIFGGIKKEMPSNHPGYEFIVKGEYKVDCKGSTLVYFRDQLNFDISHNDVADYFLCVAIDNIEDLNVLYVWIFKKDDIIRGRKFYQIDNFSIINRKEYLSEFSLYDVTDKLGDLKEFNKELRKQV